MNQKNYSRTVGVFGGSGFVGVGNHSKTVKK